MVGERGFEPPTPWSRTMKTKNSKCFIWCRLREQPTSFSLAQLYRSCTEVPKLPGANLALEAHTNSGTIRARDSVTMN